MFFFLILYFFTAVQVLKTRLSEMERKNSQLKQHSETMSRELSRLREDNVFLAAVNEEFGRENDEFKRKNHELEKENAELKEKLGRFQVYRLPESLTQSDRDSKRRRGSKSNKRKGKKPIHHGYDESSENDSGATSEEPEESDARVCKFCL